MKNTIASIREVLCPAAAALALAFFVAPDSSQADWVTVPLPNLPQDFGTYQSANLSDGQFVFGTTNSLDLQTSFGSPGLTPYSNAQSWDPSSIAIENNNLGVVGQGTFGPSNLYTFDPSNPATGFTQIPGLSMQNYNLVFHDSSSLFVEGANGSASGPVGNENSVSYVTLDGTQNKVIIDNVSKYSGGIAVDLEGNLYVTATNDFGDPGNLNLYKFTPAQLAAAITGSPLAITDGLLVTTLQADGSLAIDGQGRIWYSGYQINGIDVYDPATGVTANYVPGLDNDNYVVSTFSDGTTDYVGYINASDFTAGSALTFGYNQANNLVPEPGAAALLAFAAAGLAWRRQR